MVQCELCGSIESKRVKSAELGLLLCVRCAAAAARELAELRAERFDVDVNEREDR